MSKIISLHTITLLAISMSIDSLAVSNETEITFQANSGEKVMAFQGSFEVPENRRNEKSRNIPISYVRFPATGDEPGPPIVYLSGGPGGSGIGTAKRQRFELFMTMRQFGDVIALDQRGTGASHTALSCESSKVISFEKLYSDEDYYKVYREAFSECLGFWKDQNVDILGYTTPQSVLDIDDLREHLGVERLTLWGISYGSHLALAALKQMESRIDRIIIASAEGLDQTIKLPLRTDAYFSRLQDAINQSDGARTLFPDIKLLVRRVHTKLEKKPMLVSFEKNGQSVEFLLQRRHMQQFASGAISDPANAFRLLQLYSALDKGVISPIIPILSRFYEPGQKITFPAMPYAMDLASGQSDSRYKKIMKQATTALLASHLNPTIHYTGLISNIDLGDEFRQAPQSDVPVLLFSGTLDGRTYVESQREAIAGLTSSKAITVVNAGHNLFMSSPLVGETIEKFMRDEKIHIDKIEVPLPF